MNYKSIGILSLKVRGCDQFKFTAIMSQTEFKKAPTGQEEPDISMEPQNLD